MTRIKLAAVALVALLAVTGVAAATPGNAPADAGANDDNGQVGPPTSLPEQVPDFVGDIHDEIRSFIDGNVENLGEAVSGIAGGDDAENGENGDESDDASTTTASAA